MEPRGQYIFQTNEQATTLSQVIDHWDDYEKYNLSWIVDKNFWSKYTVLKEIGGNFGMTRRIQNKRTKQILISKSFKRKPAEDTEVQMLAQLSAVCPAFGFAGLRGMFIAPFYPDDSRSNPSYVILMDEVKGLPADKLGKLNDEQVIEIGQQILAQLMCLHEHSVVHGDVKPDNIIVSLSPLKATLIDYGSTCSIDSLLPDQFINIPLCGAISKGQSKFWAPEIQNLNVDHLPDENYNVEVDIWALGLTLWLVRHPEDSKLSRKELIDKIRSASPSSFLNRFIQSMLASKRHKRPRTAKLLEQVVQL